MNVTKMWTSDLNFPQLCQDLEVWEPWVGVCIMHDRWSCPRRSFRRCVLECDNVPFGRGQLYPAQVTRRKMFFSLVDLWVGKWDCLFFFLQIKAATLIICSWWAVLCSCSLKPLTRVLIWFYVCMANFYIRVESFQSDFRSFCNQESKEVTWFSSSSALGLDWYSLDVDL